MKVTRRKYTVKGKVRTSKAYTCRFEFKGRPYAKGGFHDKDAARKWGVDKLAALSRGEVGLVKVKAGAPVLPLIEAYADDMASHNRDPMYVYNSRLRLRRLREECGWQTLGDVTGRSFEAWRRNRPAWVRGKTSRPLAPKTLNQFLDTAAGFGAWLVKHQHLAVNPFAGVSRVGAVQRTDVRRPATIEELVRLIVSAPEARARLYRFLVYCPLRREAFEGLTWGMLLLNQTPPALALPASLNKTRKPLTLPIRQDIAAMLKGMATQAGEEITPLVFPRVPIDLWKKDLAAAEIPYQTPEGRFDMHALRMTAVMLMADAGVSFEEVHKMLGHSNRATTERWYYRNKPRASLTAAAEAMPSIGGGK